MLTSHREMRCQRWCWEVSGRRWSCCPGLTDCQLTHRVSLGMYNGQMARRNEPSCWLTRLVSLKSQRSLQKTNGRRMLLLQPGCVHWGGLCDPKWVCQCRSHSHLIAKTGLWMWKSHACLCSVFSVVVGVIFFKGRSCLFVTVDGPNWC